MSSLRARIAAFLHPPLESFQDAPEIMHAYRRLANHPDLKREPEGPDAMQSFYACARK